MRTWASWTGVLLAATVAAACSKGSGERSWMGDVRITSPSFSSGDRIPKKHAAAPGGQNVSPALQWTGIPAGTQEIVVIVDDSPPMKPIVVHWVAYGIAPTVTGIREGIPNDQPTPDGFVQGSNDSAGLGWEGPKPEEGDKPHQYSFWVYAVDVKLGLAPGAFKSDVVNAMQKGNHILASGRLIGVY